jgi:hypothetical protein
MANRHLVDRHLGNRNSVDRNPKDMAGSVLSLTYHLVKNQFDDKSLFYFFAKCFSAKRRGTKNKSRVIFWNFR